MFASLSTLVLIASVASASSHHNHKARQAGPSASVAPTCEGATTTFVCPSGTEGPIVRDAGRAGQQLVSCDNFQTNTYCYYTVPQDYIVYEEKPDGTMDAQFSEGGSRPGGCPRQMTPVITCSPAGKDSYTCQSPEVVYSCPSGYTQTGTSSADFTCTGNGQTCSYYSDSGRVDTLTPGFQSSEGCPATATQTGTCSNSLTRRRNGSSRSPAWVKSRQAVIKRKAVEPVVVVEEVELR